MKSWIQKKRALNFMKDFALGYKQDPLAHGVFHNVTYPQVEVSIGLLSGRPVKADLFLTEIVNTGEKGTGIGSYVLSDLCRRADRFRVTIATYPEEKRKQWFQRHGFVPMSRNGAATTYHVYEAKDIPPIERLRSWRVRPRDIR